MEHSRAPCAGWVWLQHQAQAEARRGCPAYEYRMAPVGLQ